MCCTYYFREIKSIMNSLLTNCCEYWGQSSPVDLGVYGKFRFRLACSGHPHRHIICLTLCTPSEMGLKTEENQWGNKETNENMLIKISKDLYLCWWTTLIYINIGTDFPVCFFTNFRDYHCNVLSLGCWQIKGYTFIAQRFCWRTQTKCFQCDYRFWSGI